MAFVFTALPAETAGPLIRREFPHLYLFLLATSGVAALLSWPTDMVFALIAVTTLLARQILMPVINTATYARAKRRFE